MRRSTANSRFISSTSLIRSCSRPGGVCCLRAWSIGVCGFYAAKSKVVRTCAYFTLAACADDIARAILIGTKKRSAAMDFLRLTRLRGIERCVRPTRIAGYSTCLSELRIIIGSIPVTGPLPHVSGHVIKSVRIRRELRHRRDACVTVFAGVEVGKMTLVRVGHPLALRTKRISPHEGLA